MLATIIAVSLAGAPLYEQDLAGLDRYVRVLSAEPLTFEQRLEKLLVDTLGTPYADGPLGEGPDGEYDTDPLIDFGRVDCVTYVEQVVAAATARDYTQLLGNLQGIRYENGTVDYERRNHFLISDWIENNPFAVEATGDLRVPTDTVTRTISRREFFELVNATGLAQLTPDRNVSLAYVPAEHAETAEATIPSPSLVVFVGQVDWLFALHCGVFHRDDDEVGRLYHASSKAGKVVAMDLGDYMRDQADRYLGFSVYRLNPPNFDPTRDR